MELIKEVKDFIKDNDLNVTALDVIIELVEKLSFEITCEFIRIKHENKPMPDFSEIDDRLELLTAILKYTKKHIIDNEV